jgi:hypothetical protein
LVGFCFVISPLSPHVFFLTGVAIILQVDELLASYIKIKDIEPKLLSGVGSWKTKMLLSSKMALVVILGSCVYLVTLAVWYTDKWYAPGFLSHL